MGSRGMSNLPSSQAAKSRYQTLQRLGGVVTNHSNVFAVWVSVGYFELDQNPRGIDGAHPDGYRLATELGSETGGVTRHRAFYIIDRSLPVAFEPGQNHNAGNAVVLRPSSNRMRRIFSRCE